MAEIRRIDKSIVHRICANQVIFDLSTAVKELLENSLDAKSTRIEVRLRNYGLDCIEVTDNGAGVPEESFQSLTLKHFTSKISQFEDLGTVNSFGFRGEALSSLCALSELSITTKTKDDPTGTLLEFDHDGRLLTRTVVARDVGTSVFLRHLFKPNPVRCKEFTKNIKREYARLVALLMEYALICTGVKLLVTNQPALATAAAEKAPKALASVLLQTQGNSDVRSNLVNVYGAKQTATLLTVAATLDLGPGAETTTATATGFISRPVAGSWRSAGDRQHFFVNGRPVEMPRLARTLNDAFRTFTSQPVFPLVLLDLRLPPHTFDINENVILDSLQQYVTALFEPFRNSFSVTPVGIFAPGIQTAALNSKTCFNAIDDGKFDKPSSFTSDLPSATGVIDDEDDKLDGGSILSSASSSISSSFAGASVGQKRKTPDLGICENGKSTSTVKSLVDRTVRIDVDLFQRCLRSPVLASQTHVSSRTCAQRDASLLIPEDEMKRVIHKQHFRDMAIIGQFNLGFILTRLNDDVFIIDQHASDEKYRYEMYQRSNCIKKQPLIRPLPLEVTASTEITILEHLAVFEQNGFSLTRNEDRPPSQQLCLTAVPFSKNSQFGLPDIYQLASLMEESISAHEISCLRLPRLLSMFASRACRSAVMVGDGLDRPSMSRIINHMAEIDQPWNCPHGRPTMRHVFDLTTLSAVDKFASDRLIPHERWSMPASEETGCI